MKNTMNALIVPAAALILVLGLLVPIFNTIQGERCSLAFSKIMESDLLGVQAPDQVLEAHAETLNYLMKHPRQTLRICLAYAAENPRDPKLELNAVLAEKAYEGIRSEKLELVSADIHRSILMADPELYQELTTN